MKPLVLTIHPRLEDTSLTPHEIHEGRRTTLRLRDSKRLTDAELAAEYWASDRFYEQAKWTKDPETAELDRRSWILYRFATMPSYDEADA